MNQLSLARLKSICSNKKTVRFALIAAAGAFAGSLIGFSVGGNNAHSFVGGLFSVGSWDLIIGVSIGASISWVQSSYLRNIASRNRDAIRAGMRCAMGGAAGGVGLVLAKSMIGGGVGHIIGWTIEGGIMGWLLAPVFPNLPRKPAIFAGLIAGFMGALLGPLLGGMFGSALGVAAADSLKGLFLGAMLTVSEKFQADSDGSLIVHWGPNEQSTILLGQEPIGVGSDKSCRIYLKQESPSQPPVVAEFLRQGDKTILRDLKNNKTTELQTGTIVNIGTLRIEVAPGLDLSALQKK